MEKKVNLTIFFNYRNYSPRFKMLLEDVFYKKMHDEKISSSDSMQQVMEFCNVVDTIEYGMLDESKVLSRYSKNERKIIINESAIKKLLDEHKDLDEEALLKNIFGRQVQNILTVSDEEIFDVTFEDILNKNGYVTPRRLTDLANDGESIGEESVINEIVGQKYKKSNDNTSSSDFSFYEEEGKDNTQNSILNDANKDSFASFEDSDTSMYQENYEMPKKSNFENVDYDYDVVDCVRRKDNNISVGSFSDFVNESKKDIDYTLEDEENYGDLKKHKKTKKSNSFFSGFKNTVSSLKEKVKSLSKKDDDFDGYYDEFENREDSVKEETQESDLSTYFGNFNYLDEKEKIKNRESENIDVKKEVDNENQNTSSNDLKNSATIVDNFDYSTNDIDVDKKFDSIIEAIMNEKRTSSYIKKSEENITVENTIDNTKNDDVNQANVEIKEEKVDNSSIYDSFAEELETFERIRRRRRGK